MALRLCSLAALLSAPLAPLAQEQFTLRVGSATIEIRTETDQNGDPIGTYRIRREVGPWGTRYETSYLARLRYGSKPGEPSLFDPRGGAPAGGTGAFPDPPDDARLMLVQYFTHPLREYRQLLAQSGVRARPVRLLAGNTEIVLTEDGAARAWLQAQLHSGSTPNGVLRALLPYRPEYRFEPGLLADLERGALRPGIFVIEVLDSGPRMKGQILARILNLGGVIEQTPPSGKLLRATLTPEQLRSVATWAEVLSIDTYVAPRTYSSHPSPTGAPSTPLDRVRKDGGAAYLDFVNIDGAGVKVAVTDSGIANHPQLPSVTVNTVTGAYDPAHGTGTAGIVGALPVPGTDAQGVLANSELVFSSFNGVADRHLHTKQLVMDGCVLETNSWGKGPGGYSTTTQDLDEIAAEHPLLILHSMGLATDQQPDVLARAKNVLSIGAVMHKEQGPADHEPMPTLGGIQGEACSDGMPGVHVKPDLCYWYDLIWTTTVDASGDPGWDNFAGTSASCPQVAGYAGLVNALWHAGVFGHEFPPWEPLEKHAPRPSTVRALLVNSAQRYPLGVIARHQQGWGRPDLRSLHERAATIFVVDESIALQEDTKARWRAPLHSGADGLRVTLVYRDPPSASAGGAAMLHDDLSLQVVAPDGVTVFCGNHGLGAANESSDGGENDAHNLIENVFLSRTSAGAFGKGDWEVIVHALKVLPTYDANFNLLVEPTANFALVISGLDGPEIQAPDTDTEQDD